MLRSRLTYLDFLQVKISLNEMLNIHNHIEDRRQHNMKTFTFFGQLSQPSNRHPNRQHLVFLHTIQVLMTKIFVTKYNLYFKENYDE